VGFRSFISFGEILVKPFIMHICLKILGE
jgi:hypothetical protein